MADCIAKKMGITQRGYLLLRLATRVVGVFGLRVFFESFQISLAYQIKNNPTRTAATSKIRTTRFAEEFDAAGFDGKV